jgi:membrane-bound metal-dependent hydrolase YbcI (DUF457 family)
MDTVTHALVGAAISDCWFRKRLGPVATPFALLAAAVPDIDSLTYAVSTEMALANHRGYTHSLLPIFLAAPLIGVAGNALASRRGGWKMWWVLALLCLLSHTFFDLLTSWGTMPLLPFSNARLSWDIIPIIDAFLLAVTIGSFVANRILRWERVDTFINPLVYPVVHRHPRRQKVGDWFGKIAVGLIAVYLLFGWQQNRQAVRLATEALRQQGAAPVEVRALPILLTYIAYDIAARDADGTIYNSACSSYAQWASGEQAALCFRVYPTLPAAETAEELASPDGRFFAWYSQNMFVAARSGDAGSGKGIVLQDRRFFRMTDPDASRFEMTFLDGVPGAALVQPGDRRMNIREELSRLWELVRHGTGAGFDAPAGALEADNADQNVGE